MAGGGGEGSALQHAVRPERDSGFGGNGVVDADDIECGPIDPVGFRRIEWLEGGRVLHIEGEDGAGEAEVGQVFEVRMFVEVIGVPDDGDGEIGGIAEDAADLESCWRWRSGGRRRRPGHRSRGGTMVRLGWSL